MRILKVTSIQWFLELSFSTLELSDIFFSTLELDNLKPQLWLSIWEKFSEGELPENIEMIHDVLSKVKIDHFTSYSYYENDDNLRRVIGACRLGKIVANKL